MSTVNNTILSNMTKSRDVKSPNLKSEYAINFNVKVVKRIINILHENGHLKRTNLAGKSGLNYNKCMRYVDLLYTLGWIRILFEDGSCFITITDKGLETIELLKNFK